MTSKSTASLRFVLLQVQRGERLGAAVVVYRSVSSQQRAAATHAALPAVQETPPALWRLHAEAAQSSAVKLRVTF